MNDTAPAPPSRSRRTRRPGSLRGWIQAASLVALNFSWGPQAKWFCPPVLNCHSCALAWFACPVGVLIHYSGFRVFPLIAAGTLLLFGALAGRLLCGWVCPFGTVQDWLHRIPTRKFALPRWMDALKYVVLALMVFLFPYLWGELTQASFCRYCPATTLSVQVPDLVRGATKVFTASLAVKLGILAAVLALSVFFSRFFCRVLCPIGALMAPANFLALWRTRRAEGACTLCARCDDACPTDDRPSERLDGGRPANRSLDCIVCHDCVKACPTGRRAAEPQGG